MSHPAMTTGDHLVNALQALGVDFLMGGKATKGIERIVRQLACHVPARGTSLA